MAKNKTNEMFVDEGDGKRSDAGIFEPILDNEAADLLIGWQAVQRAVERGMDREVAKRLYLPEGAG